MRTIKLFAFNGAGFRSHRDLELQGLVRSGHVGIGFEEDERILGFHPTLKAVIDAGGESALITALKNHIRQPGSFQEDQNAFLEAVAYAKSHGLDTHVYVYDINVSDDEYKCIQYFTEKWLQSGQVFSYNFPDFDSSFTDGEYNCATFLNVLGLQLPSEKPLLNEFVEEIKEKGAELWQPVN